MTFEAFFARPVMALAAALAPASRRDWMTAMRQEFAALQDGAGSLGWATGCLANALGWRARAEAGFGFGFVVAVLTGSWIVSPRMVDLMSSLPPADWIVAVSSTNIALQAAACFLLALAWPRRALIVGLLLPLVWQDGAMFRFFLLLLEPVLTNPLVRAGNRPETLTVVYALGFFFDTMAPCLLGAALGWSIRRGWRAPRTVAA